MFVLAAKPYLPGKQTGISVADLRVRRFGSGGTSNTFGPLGKGSSCVSSSVSVAGGNSSSSVIRDGGDSIGVGGGGSVAA